MTRGIQKKHNTVQQQEVYSYAAAVQKHLPSWLLAPDVGETGAFGLGAVQGELRLRSMVTNSRLIAVFLDAGYSNVARWRRK